MHRNRTWLLDPIELRTQRNRILPIEGGDGSTLSLDFTTGVLDPRLTFSRTSDATFINSSGQVQWAAANNFTNSTFSGSSGTTVPNWSFSQIAGSATVSLSGTELTITCTTATRARVVQNIGTSTGLFVTTQVKVTARSMAFPLNEVIAYSVNGSSSEQYKVNGVDRNSSYTGWNVGDVISLTCIPTNGASAQAVIGIGASSAQPAGQSITITDVQAEPGTVVRSVIPTGTSGSYQAPRFDYDPTTGSPRGLLIEGQAVNIMFRSQAMNTGPWGNAGNMTVSETGSGSPANDATSNVVTWNNGTGAGSAWLQQNVAVSAGSLVVGNAYTWSVWLKSRGGRRVNVFANIQGVTGNREVRVDFGVSPPTVTSTVATGWTSIQTPTIVEYPNGWYKVTTGGTLPSGATSVNFGMSNSDAVPGSGTNGFEAWGYQLEAGSGASSYIPTGASQGNRTADSCVMTGTAFSSWFAGATEGVIYAEYERPRKLVVGADHFLVGSVYAAGSFIASYVQNSNLFPSAAISPGGGFRISTVSVAAVTPTKQATRWFGTNNVLVVANGVVGSTHAATTGTPSITMFSIGSSSTSGTAATGDWLNACISRIKFWPTALPNAQLQSLTT